jgi:hypothetical protein
MSEATSGTQLTVPLAPISVRHHVLADGQEISAELQRHCSDAGTWERMKRADMESARDLFVMHGEEHWSLRRRATVDDVFKML